MHPPENRRAPPARGAGRRCLHRRPPVGLPVNVKGIASVNRVLLMTCARVAWSALVLVLGVAIWWWAPQALSGRTLRAALLGHAQTPRPLLLPTPSVQLPPTIAQQPGVVVVELQLRGTGDVATARILASDVPAANPHVLDAAKAYRFRMPPALQRTGAVEIVVVRLDTNR